MEGTAYAVASGTPFNRFITVHWEHGGVDDDLAATARFLKLATDWIRSMGGSTAYAWVREGGPEKGRHAHILLHLPPDLAGGFNKLQRSWLGACGALWRGGVLYSRPVGRTLRQALTGGADYAANLGEVLDYMLKGADVAAHEALKLSRSDATGAIVGKRCGLSRNIDRAARRLPISTGV